MRRRRWCLAVVLGALVSAPRAGSGSEAENQYPINDVIGDEDDSDGGRSKRGTTARRTLVANRWPGCTVPYVMVTATNCAQASTRYPNACARAFASTTAANATQALVQQAADALGAKTRALGVACKMEHVPIPPATGPVLYVINVPNSCYVHHVGYSNRTARPNVMSLGWCATSLPSIKHEVLHVFGLEHEHQSPASAGYVTRCASGSCQPNAHNCRARPAVGWANEGAMDFASAMMYPLNRASACGLQLTLAGSALAEAQGMGPGLLPIGRGARGISDGDAATVAAHYRSAETRTFEARECAFNTIPRCPDPNPDPDGGGGGSSSGCIDLYRLGDGTCDAAAACYNHDGGDCAPPTPGPSDPAPGTSFELDDPDDASDLDPATVVMLSLVGVGVAVVLVKGSVSGATGLCARRPGSDHQPLLPTTTAAAIGTAHGVVF